MKEEIRKIVAQLIWDSGAIKIAANEPFVLTSGNRSPFYVDCRLLISLPVVRDMITSFAHWFYENENLLADCIAGGETAGIPFAAWLAERLNKPFIYIRKAARQHGRESQIEGSLSKGSSVLLYEDLITDGNSKLVFVQAVRNAGATINKCLTVFDRQQGGQRTLQSHEISLHSLTDLDTTLEFGTSSQRLSGSDYSSIQHYLEHPAEWHAERDYEFHEVGDRST